MSRIGGGIGGGLAARSTNTTSNTVASNHNSTNIGGIRRPTTAATNQATASTPVLQQ